MTHVKPYRRATVRACGLIVCLMFSAMLPAVAQTAEDSTLRALVERFFAAYRQKDIQSLMMLWSREAPDLAANEQAMRRTFAENDRIQLESLTVLEMAADKDKALVRVLLNVSAVEAKTGRAAVGFGKMSRTLHLVKERGEWKVWQYVSGEEELAAALADAKTEEKRRALLEARNESVTVELVRALIVRGVSSFVKGEFAAAQEVAAIALNIASKLGDKASMATALRLTGSVHAARGDYTEALDYFRQSLTLVEEIGDKRTIAGTLNNIGNVYDVLGDGVQAAEYFQRSLSIASEIKQPQIMKMALNNLGNVYKVQGDRVRALEYLQRSLKLAEELKDRESLAMSLNNIGTIHSAQGSYQQALEFYRKGLALYEELGMRASVPRALGNIGLAHFHQGDYELALDYHQKALKMAEEVGDKEVIAGSLNNIGDVYAGKGDYGRALEYYRRGLALAEAISNKVLVVDAWSDIGEVSLMLGNYREAVEHTNRAAALARESDLPTSFWLARTVAGKAHLALKQLDLARQSFLDAIATIEKLRDHVVGGEQEQARFFEDKTAPYYAMVDLSLAQDNHYQALTYGERAKSRLLADVLSNGRLDISKAMTVEERERERMLNNQVVSLNAQIYRERTRQPPDPSRLADLDTQRQKARLEYEAFQTNLYAVHSELKLQRGQAPSLTLDQMGELLPDADSALLEFVVSEEKIYLFVLTRSKDKGRVELKTHRLAINGKDLVARVRDFRRRLAERDLEFREPAHQLYDLLLEPAAKQLRGKSLLCIVPDGVLWELPFQALQSREGRYLIEDHALFYAPSLGVLYGIERSSRGKRGVASTRRLDAKEVGPRRGAIRLSKIAAPPPHEPFLLAFGNPVVSPQDVTRARSLRRDEELGPLPEAEHEVNKLRELYKPANSRVYVGAEAQEQRAKAEMGRYRVLHFATHGVLDDLNPMYSHLVLSQSGVGEGGEDGLLHASEIMRLDLKSDLVVLSACQTARGRFGVGEGVMGMSWALFVAGSPTTVVSQWSVESSSTTQLMVEFHRNLLQARERTLRLSKAEALRKASLSLLKNSRYGHPFYWAGFVLIGDGMRPL
jgi:CHAT domain-containing protein/tetratricopeptide (TPR) repeat protein